jgi:small conductance mechanosensitive channel
MHHHFRSLSRACLAFAFSAVVAASIGTARAYGAETGAAPASPASQTATAARAGSPAEQNPMLVKQAEILEKLEDLVRQRQALLEKMRKFEGDQREAATLQVRDVEKDIRRLLADLTDLVEKLRQENLDATALSKRARELLEAEAGILRTNIEALQADVASLRKDQSKLDTTELVARKDRIARQLGNLDGLLDDLHENTERAQRVGVDTSASRAYLDKLIEGRASSVAGELKLTVDQLESLQAQLGKAAGPDKEKLEAQIVAMQTEKAGAAASLTNIVALMKKRGLDDTTYSELLIRTTGQISTETLSADVAKSFLSHQLDDAEEWIRERGPTIAFRILFVIAILVGFWILAGLVRRGVRRALQRSHIGASQLMQRFAAKAAGGLVLMVGILVVLAQFNIELTHMLAGLGIAGFIVGFALQDVLANFASGIMILVYRPYDVGDWIEVPEALGKVHYMNLVSTTILTGDNQKLLVPNRKIWGSTIRNITSEDRRRVDLTFGIGYSDDMSAAERILHEIVAADERVIDTPEPLIRMTELGESSVNFILRAWCRTEDYWELRWHITRRVKERFDEEGITIPFPQRDVHLHRAAARAIPGRA